MGLAQARPNKTEVDVRSENPSQPTQNLNNLFNWHSVSFFKPGTRCQVLVYYCTWCLAAFLSLSSLMMTCFNPASFLRLSGSAGLMTRDLFFGGFTPSPPHTPHPGEKRETDHPSTLEFNSMTRKV